MPKCIGKQCGYNQCNAGEYCSLPNSFFTQKGDDCVIHERICELEEEKIRLDNKIERMMIWEQEIQELQKTN